MIIPTKQQCLDYFEQYKVPVSIRKHCLKVRELAVFLARKLKAKGVEINLDLVEAAALLHDLFKHVAVKEYRGKLSEEQIEIRQRLGKKYPNQFENEIIYGELKEEFPEFAEAMRNEGDPHNRERTWDETIVHYADYRVFQEKIVTLEKRFDYFRKTYSADKNFWDEYLIYCQKEERKILNPLGLKPEELAQEMARRMENAK